MNDYDWNVQIDSKFWIDKVPTTFRLDIGLPHFGFWIGLGIAAAGFFIGVLG